MLCRSFKVNSPNVEYTAETIKSKYEYSTTKVTKGDKEGEYVVSPAKEMYEFSLERKVPKFGLMLVGLGGNNGSTVAAVLIANKNKITWETKDGLYPLFPTTCQFP